MAIQVTAKSMEEIPEEMREFVTEDNGVFSYDSGKAFAALKAERESAKTARNAQIRRILRFDGKVLLHFSGKSCIF